MPEDTKIEDIKIEDTKTEDVKIREKQTRVIRVEKGYKPVLIREETYKILKEHESWDSTVGDINRWVDDLIRRELGR